MNNDFVDQEISTESEQTKPRVVISTDISGGDADDIQSLVHAMYYLDEIDLRGVVASPSADSNRSPEMGLAEMGQVYEAYETDYANLSSWGDYPTPESLYSISYPGAALTLEEGGTFEQSSPGAEAIAREAMAASPEDKLYVLTWGAPTDAAIALQRYPEIADSVVVYTILANYGANSDTTAMDTIKSFEDVVLIDNNTTFRGMYAWDSPTYGDPSTFPSEFVENNPQTNQPRNSALAQHFMEATDRVFQDILKMGDTPSFLYLIDSADDNDPTSPASWGGEFVQKSNNHYVDRRDTAATPLGRSRPVNGAGTVSRHAEEFLADWVSRLERAERQKTNAIEDNFNTDEDTALAGNVISNDTGANLTITQVNGQANINNQVTLTSGAQLSLNADGTFSYDPNSQFDSLDPGESNTDSFTYTISDGTETDTATVTITINGVSESEATPNADEIKGTTGNDTIDALAGNDTIRGLGGNDELFGNTGADRLLGQGGNDLLIGGISNDTVNGGAGNDSLEGNDDNDVLNGGRGADSVDGGSGNDRLQGGDGSDILIGGTGNDNVKGGNGNDTLSGVDPSGLNPGLGERDALFGQDDADLFVLGDENAVFYDDGDLTTASEGNVSRAIIRDFEVGIDQIQLNGIGDDYLLRTTNSGNTNIFYRPVGEVRDLIGIVRNTTGLNLQDSSTFSFV
jgi:VCBS repeat-containing protein